LPLPTWFHTKGPASAKRPAVWQLPADSGLRTIPVLQFFGYSPEIPVAITVGFVDGDATIWYPQVDVHRSAALANGLAATTMLAIMARAAVGTYRDGLQPTRRDGKTLPAPEHLNRQLEWQRLRLLAKPDDKPTHTHEFRWVRDLRQIPNALWVTQPGTSETERFVFYEGATPERPAITVALGKTSAVGRRHLVLKNPGKYAVHDVLFVHREGGKRYVFFAPQIPAETSAGFVIEEHATETDAAFATATTARLRKRLTAAPLGKPYTDTDCVMGRQPAIPTEAATGYQVFAGELDVLFDLWGPRFFEAEGTTIVYREDPGYIDAMMPLSLFTDMHSYIKLSRLGLAVIEDIRLP
jgi:hypothetical protein